MQGKTKDPELRKNVIIELAKANGQKSIPELSTLTHIPFETIDNILKEKEISILIDKSDEKIPIITKTGPREAYKYRLKSSLDNLLSIFNYLNDKNWKKQLMQTDYYKTLIPEIKKKAKVDFKLNDHESQTQFKRHEITKIVSGALYSPAAVNFLLKVDPDILNEAQIKAKKLYIDSSHKKIDTFIFILIGLTYSDIIDETITPYEYVASLTPEKTIIFQTSEQS